MKFRTEIDAGAGKHEISYSSPVMLIGSCFATEMGHFFTSGKMDVMINPFGVLYNPDSVAGGLELIIKGRKILEEDLHFFDNKYLSFYHGTGFSLPDKDKMLERLNSELETARVFLKRSRFLFITFGTARVYKWKESGKSVSNCHKIPESEFTRELLSVDHIKDSWTGLIEKLRTFSKNLQIVFTVSPVRHWKDGAHGNQISKSVLILAIDELMKANPDLDYFPSYELLLDDLRDYRFYKEDMLHPSSEAVKYIWEKFQDTYFSASTRRSYEEIYKIVNACSHRLMSDNPVEIKKFCNNMLNRIKTLENKYKFLSFSSEKDHFISIIDEPDQQF